MSFRDLLVGYQDPHGVMLDRNGIIDGNAILYTGTKFQLLHDLGEESAADRDTLDHITNTSEIESGLLQRYNKPGDRQAHDDYHIANVDFLDGGALARRVVSYGRKHWYCWNNQQPGKFALNCFFVRHPGWWASMKAAAGEWLNPFDQLMSFFDLAYILIKEDGSSGTIMDYLQYKTYMRNTSWWTEPLTRLGCVLFKAAYLKRHPRGIKESYIEYYGASYPFSQLPDGFF